MSSFNANVVEFFKDLAEWLNDNLGDPSIANTLLRDLNLSDTDINPSDVARIKELADQIEPDALTLEQTITNVLDTSEALLRFCERISSNGNSAWDVLYLFGKLSSGSAIRSKAPLLNAIGQLFLFISTDPRRLREFDPAIISRISSGADQPLGDSEALVHRLSSLGLLLGLTEELADKLDLYLDAYHGWDPEPDPANPDGRSATPLADRALANAHTLVLKTEQETTGQVALSVMPVPAETGGPGLMLSLGGGLTSSKQVGRVDYELDVGASSALVLWIPFGGDTSFQVFGDPSAYLGASIIARGPSDEVPALRFGDADGTRFDMGALGAGFDLSGTQVAGRLFVREAELLIALGEGDGLLSSLSGSEIKIAFDVDLRASSDGGLSIDGGLLTQAVLPVNESVGGFLDIHTVSLKLAPLTGGDDDGASLSLSTGFGLKLGPFQASVDQVGFQFDFAFREGNLGIMDADVGFKSPKGIGMVLDAGLIRGGGYLQLDVERGEYFGVLELKFASWGIKAIGVLSTKLPDGSPGFALLLLIYADLPRIHLGLNIYWDGVGGVLGLQHGADITALEDGIPSGVFDDVLFPANPVADAPRIINRLRVIFPIRPHAFLVGLMFRLTWGTPAVGDVRVGVIASLDNVLGTDAPVALDSIILVGVIRIGLPESKRGDVARIICDFLGYLDFDSERFGLYARLRDSKLAGNLELTGSLLLRIDYGDNPSFLIAVGGFHPRFEDLPSDLPAKLDRVGMRFNIGFIKISVSCYLAVTSATVQFGARVDVKARIGPVSLAGYIGFDALIYYEPFFRFELDFEAGVAIKFKRWNLVSVDVRGSLSGPGLWHITGRFSFGILWWDISKSFDEQWGDRPELDVPGTAVSGLLQAAFSDQDNWVAALPAGVETLVSLAASSDPGALLSHPLGQLRVSQKVAPLGVTLEKYGETAIDGPNRFDLQAVRVGDEQTGRPETIKEHLARANYLNLSEEDRLTNPSFERFDTGIAVGTDTYAIPDTGGIDGSLEYETRELTLPERDNSTGIMLALAPVLTGVFYASAEQQSSSGAAARTTSRRFNKLKAREADRIVIDQPGLAVIGADGQADASVSLGREAQTNITLAQQQLNDSGTAGLQLIEAFELA